MGFPNAFCFCNFAILQLGDLSAPIAVVITEIFYACSNYLPKVLEIILIFPRPPFTRVNLQEFITGVPIVVNYAFFKKMVAKFGNIQLK